MPTIISTVETFWVITGPILKIFHVKTSGLDYSDRQHRHEAVLDALKAHDPEAATKAIQADLTWGGKIMIDWLAEREEEQAQASLKTHSTRPRSEEHTSELQSLMRNSYADFCVKKKTNNIRITQK